MNFLPPVLDAVDPPVVIDAVMHAAEFIGDDDGGWPELPTGLLILEPGHVVLAQELFHYAELNVFGKMINHQSPPQ
jgi:hypothetical protein